MADEKTKRAAAAAPSIKREWQILTSKAVPARGMEKRRGQK
jgi:hypothetical protein